MNNLKRDGRYELSKKISISFDDLKVSHIADEDINDALMHCIEESGLTMAQFARKSGITPSSIVRYRKKIAVPSLETIVITCIVTRTNIFQALYLISLAGYNVFYSDENKVYFLLIILSRYLGISINTANDILNVFDIKPFNYKRKYIN